MVTAMPGNGYDTAAAVADGMTMSVGSASPSSAAAHCTLAPASASLVISLSNGAAPAAAKRMVRRLIPNFSLNSPTSSLQGNPSLSYGLGTANRSPGAATPRPQRKTANGDHEVFRMPH